MSLSFSKYHGAGNDFIVIDDRAGFFPIDSSLFIERLCHRRFGIGADGLLLLQSSKCADFRMRIFNPDGKEAAMCGSGIRCLVQYIRSLGFKEEQYRIETMNEVIPCRVRGEKISVKLSKPRVMHWGLPLQIESEDLEVYVVHTGVPHAVIFVEDLEEINLKVLGSQIRHHSLFEPYGVNVNFAKLGPDGTVRMRTYERGVEGETLACGTGAAAVALTVYQKWNIPGPIRLLSASKESVEVDIEESSTGGKDVELTGGATFLFEGRIPAD